MTGSNKRNPQKGNAWKGRIKSLCIGILSIRELRTGGTGKTRSNIQQQEAPELLLVDDTLTRKASKGNITI